MADSTDWVFEHHLPCYESQKICIDEDGDEIEIVNQSDYDIFLIKRSKHQHLQVAPVNATTTNDTPKPQETSSKAAPQTQTPTADDTNDGRRIHANVKCDYCLMTASAKPMEENVASTTGQTKAAEPATAEKDRPSTAATNVPLTQPQQPQTVPDLPSPSPGIKIWNNFGDMLMLDPMDGAEVGDSSPSSSFYPFDPNARRVSESFIKLTAPWEKAIHAATATTSQDTMDGVEGFFSSLGLFDPISRKNSSKSTNLLLPNVSKKKKNSVTKEAGVVQSAADAKKQDSTSSSVDISDLFSDSETDSFSERFIKFTAPTKKKQWERAVHAATATTSQDTMDGAEGGDCSPFSSFGPFDPNARKISYNSLNRFTALTKKKPWEKAEISDLGSDSETDSVSERFIKLKKQWKRAVHAGKTPSFLNKSNVMDFAQMCADLKAHIAQEEQRSANSPAKVAQENNTTTSDAVPDEPRAVPVFNNTNTTNATNVQTNKPEEQRFVPVNHSDERINSARYSLHDNHWLQQRRRLVDPTVGWC